MKNLFSAIGLMAYMPLAFANPSFSCHGTYENEDGLMFVVPDISATGSGEVSMEYMNKKTLCHSTEVDTSTIRMTCGASSLDGSASADCETLTVNGRTYYLASNVAEASRQRKTTAAVTAIKCAPSSLPQHNDKNKDGTELHAVGIYEGPSQRGTDPSANKVDIQVYRSEKPIFLALINHAPVVWNIKIERGAVIKEILLNSAEGTQLAGINLQSTKVTRQNFGLESYYEDCAFFRTIAPQLEKYSGLAVQSFQGAYRGIGFPIRTQSKSVEQAPLQETNTYSSAQKPDALMEEGMAAFEKGDYRTALSTLTPLADKGVPMAQNTLGRMYTQGQGVPQDFAKALLLFQQAAKQNLPNAQSNLGVLYASGKGVPQDYKQAISWFRKAADQGFVLAMNNLATIYDSGVGITKDPIEAEKWRNMSRNYRPPESRDSVQLQLVGSDDFKNGLNYYYAGNYRAALGPFLSAANKGNPEAQLKLESMYLYGEGVEQSSTQSKYWANKAAAQGYSNNDGRDRIFLHDTSSGKTRPSVNTK